MLGPIRLRPPNLGSSLRSAGAVSHASLGAGSAGMVAAAPCVVAPAMTSRWSIMGPVVPGCAAMRPGASHCAGHPLHSMPCAAILCSRASSLFATCPHASDPPYSKEKAAKERAPRRVRGALTIARPQGSRAGASLNHRHGEIRWCMNTTSVTDWVCVPFGTDRTCPLPSSSTRQALQVHRPILRSV